MELLEFLIMICMNAGIFLWVRMESRADIRHMDTKLDANRQLINEIHHDMKKELKELHCRLISLEKNNVMKEHKKDTGKK